MTTLNHAITGATIAMAVKTPWLAVPLALASHYVCDVIPHFGIYEDDHIRRNASFLFRAVTIGSIFGTLALFALIPSITPHHIDRLRILLCILAATLPDIVWVPLYVREVRSGSEAPMNAFDRFHQAIQWYEKPLGLFIEAAWLLLVGSVLLLNR